MMRFDAELELWLLTEDRERELRKRRLVRLAAEARPGGWRRRAVGRRLVTIGERLAASAASPVPAERRWWESPSARAGVITCQDR